MGRRGRLLILGLVLVLANGLGIGLPSTALADAGYSSCPTFAQFQSDVQAISGTGTITFIAANCTIPVAARINVQANSTVTIMGNGLTLTGGTAEAPAEYNILGIGQDATLTLDHVTVEYGMRGVSCNVNCGINRLRLINSVVRGNAQFGVSAARLDAIDSTIRDNGGSGYAGGPVNVINSTISDNGVVGMEIGTSPGGTLGSVLFSTIAGNRYGLRLSGSSPMGATELAITGNVLVSDQLNCMGAGFVLADGGGNRSTDDTCDFSASSSHENVDPDDLHLGTPGDDGGPIPLLSGSSAIDAVPAGIVDSQFVCLDVNGAAIVDPTTSQPILVDQRGVSRPYGSGCDAGAFEAVWMGTITTASDTSVSDAATSITLSASVVPDSGITNQGTVTFNVTDNESNTIGDPVSATVSNGQASANFVPTTSLAPGNYTITAAYHDAGWIFNDSQDGATLTVTPGPAASITILPGDATASVNDNVSETATVLDAAGYPVADETLVTFTVTGTNSVSENVPTVNGVARFQYSSIFPGSDTLTVTSGAATPAGASITWQAPASTARASLSAFNSLGTSMFASVQTGDGSTSTGWFSYADRAVRLSQVHLSSLVVSGSQATLYGDAQLANGDPVTFRLDATEFYLSGQVRLQLSNGYDSGVQHVGVLRITVQWQPGVRPVLWGRR